MTQRTSIRRHGVVAVLIRGEQLLVVRRSRHVEAPGAYCFPGGGIEAGESEDAALRREMVEELGASIVPVRRLWRSVTSWDVDLCWWLGELPETESLVPNPAEIESIHWLTIAEMLALDGLLESNREFLAALERGEFRI
jgi:8-oxo-dGTP pyrophosphatase MutT (NUDIX family)